MDKIVYSKIAFEDLQKIKYEKSMEDVIQGIVLLNKIVDFIEDLVDKKGHENFNEEFYYIKIDDYFVFYIIEDKKFKIVRILSENLDYIEEIFN